MLRIIASSFLATNLPQKKRRRIGRDCIKVQIVGKMEHHTYRLKEEYKSKLGNGKWEIAPAFVSTSHAYLVSRSIDNSLLLSTPFIRQMMAQPTATTTTSVLCTSCWRHSHKMESVTSCPRNIRRYEIIFHYLGKQSLVFCYVRVIGGGKERRYLSFSGCRREILHLFWWTYTKLIDANH